MTKMIRSIYLLFFCAALVSADRMKSMRGSPADPESNTYVHIDTDAMGGSPAEPGSFPYMASIQFLRKHICGGALITKRHVITSASCLAFAYKESDKLQSFTVLLGTINQSKGGTRHRVSRISAHPYYAWYDPQYNTTDYDIGVIRLANEVVLSEDVQPVTLGFQFVEDVAMLLLGWGKSQEEGPDTEFILTYGSVHYLNNKKCQKYFPDIKLKDRHLCNLPSTGIGACTTDLGGPLISENTLVGVLTNVRNCGNGKPDIYVSVFFHAHFIVDMLKEEEED